MAREYCKVLTAKGIKPQIYSRNLTSSNVKSFEDVFPRLQVQQLDHLAGDIRNWIVCTNIESHEEVCSKLQGSVYCEKPYAHASTYATRENISILMNRRYYYWVEFIKDVIDSGKIVKVVACIPEKNVDALITQSIHVIDLLWYLTGPFQSAVKTGSVSPTFVLSTDRSLPVVINMNYGSHENFSLRFYSDSGTVYEAKPLESFSYTEGMEVREPDDEMPLRSYRPIIHPLPYTATRYKPGLGELVDDLMGDSPTRLPTLAEHRQIHAWMEDNML